MNSPGHGIVASCDQACNEIEAVGLELAFAMELPEVGEGQVVAQKVLAQMALNRVDREDLGDLWMKSLYHC